MKFVSSIEGSACHLATLARLKPALVIAFILVLLPGVSLAKPRPKTSSSNIADGDYVSALATANRFLHAWQVQDHETGVLLLTDAAKQHTSEEGLDSFFSPMDSTEEGFEITRGKRLQTGRYMFHVALWQSIPGKNSRARPHFSEI